MARSYHIDINDIIGYPITKEYVRGKLAPLKGKHVDVRINSYGGDVQTALDIRQQFVDHGDVTVYVFGMTASAATILAMGAKKIVMSRYALMLVHKCSGYVDAWGMFNEEELSSLIAKIEKEQTDLTTIDGVIANLYASRSGKSVEEMAKVMSEAKWLSADEVKALGLADEIDEDKDGEGAPKMSAALREHFVACGLPIPPLAPAAAPKDGSTAEARSILSALKRLFTSAEKQEPTNNTPQNMNKKITLACICAALSMEHLTGTEDGSAELTAEQLQKIEDRLAALQGEVAEKQSRIDELEAEVKDLKAGDGAQESHVETATAEETLPGVEAAGFFNKFADII